MGHEERELEGLAVRLTELIVARIDHRFHQWERFIMSELNDAVTRITTSVQNEIAAVVAALNAPNPDVAAAVTQLNALSDKLDAETTAVTPAPAPAPAA